MTRKSPSDQAPAGGRSWPPPDRSRSHALAEWARAGRRRGIRRREGGPDHGPGASDLDRGGRAQRPARFPDGPRVGRLPALDGGGWGDGPEMAQERAVRPGPPRPPDARDGRHGTAPATPRRG